MLRLIYVLVVWLKEEIKTKLHNCDGSSESTRPSIKLVLILGRVLTVHITTSFWLSFTGKQHNDTLLLFVCQTF